MALLDVLTRSPQLPRAVERPRLRRLLLDGGEPGRLLVAPAGSGKTVAAAQLLGHAARTAGVRTGWCRVAPAVSGGADLVRLAARALGGGDVDDPGATPLERAAALLDLLDDGPVVLVVDDYDLARPEECDSVLAEVLALAAPDCRIVVCTASRPAGLLGRASVGQVRVVGPDELAFTEDEVGALLDLHGHDPALAADLHAASSGWPTAVAVLAETTAPRPTDDRSRERSAASDRPRAPSAGNHLDAAVEVVLDRAGLGQADEADDLLAVLSLVPAIGAAEVAALGLGAERLTGLAGSSALLRPVGDGWALLDLVRRPLQHRLGAARIRRAAARVAPVLAEDDPVAAANLLMDVGDAGSAADLLARRASAVSPDAALPLLYRMPADVRRRLPPLLSAARATVEMDTALAGAEQRLAAASDARERLEAQIAIGTILVHRGQLASAAATLESALRATGGPPLAGRPETAPEIGRDDQQAVATATAWLALARFWAGDIDGAAAAVAIHTAEVHGAVADHPVGDVVGPSAVSKSQASDASVDDAVEAPSAHGAERKDGKADGSPAVALQDAGTGRTGSSDALGAAGGGMPLIWWVAAEVALARDDVAAVERTVEQLRSAGWSSAAATVTARRALALGDDEAAAIAAATAYRAAAARGGLDLLLAAPVHAWCLARSGRWEEAAAVADELRRRLGAVDTGARLHADLVAEACAAHRGDAVARIRATRAITSTRRLGYAPVEATVRRWLPTPPPPLSPKPRGTPVKPPRHTLDAASASAAGPEPVATTGAGPTHAVTSPWHSHPVDTETAGAAAAGPGQVAGAGPDGVVGSTPESAVAAEMEQAAAAGPGRVTGAGPSQGVGSASSEAVGAGVGLASGVGLGQMTGGEPDRAVGVGAVAASAGWAGLEVGLLGPITVHVDGQAVLDGAWRSRKAREVLLVLVLAGESGLSRDQVIEAVWPEREPARGRTSLRTALSELRQVLEPNRPPGEPSRFVITQADRVAVRARSDLAEAERLLAQATAAATTDTGEPGSRLTAAWALFRGSFAADEAYTESLDEARRSAERLQLDVAEALVAAGLASAGTVQPVADDAAPYRLPMTAALLVAAAAHILQAEPWRTDLAQQVADACRAAGDEVQARRAERLARA